MLSKTMLLLVEDDARIAEFMTAILETHDYLVQHAESGKEALALFTSYSPDLVLLDLGLVDMDGLEVLKKIRDWRQTPVLVVSARGFEREKVQALDLGADDYITKPFSTAEFLARIRTALRRGALQHSALETPVAIFQVGQLKIDYLKRSVTLEAQEIHFTPIEYKILVLLSQNAGRVLTHDFLMREVWGPYTNENKALRVNVANIRRKIEKDTSNPVYLKTELGVGYRMVEELL